MSRKLLAGGGLAIVLGTVSVLAWAGGAGFRGPMAGGAFSRGLPWDRIAQKVELSADQISQLKAIDRDRIAKEGQVKAREDVLRFDLRGLMTAPQPDRNAIFTKIDELAPVRAELAKINLGAMIDAKKVLGDKADEVRKFMRSEFAAARRFGARGAQDERGDLLESGDGLPEGLDR